MQKYFEKFYIQEKIRTPNPFYPQFDNNPYIWGKFGDGREIQALYIQDTSTEMIIANAHGLKARGRFATTADADISDGVTVRRVSDNSLFRIIGKSKQSPAKARSQIKLFEAEYVTR